MDNRKTYVRPAVESEVMMEQTSLACNVIMATADETGYPTCGPTSNPAACIRPLLKTSNWADSFPCSGPELPEGFACGIQYS